MRILDESGVPVDRKWVIYDWAYNRVDPEYYETFDDAEEVLTSRLGDNYESDRGEYFIESIDYVV